MFRRRPAKRGAAGFARSREDITALGDSFGDMLTSPVRDAPPMARAASLPGLELPRPQPDANRRASNDRAPALPRAQPSAKTNGAAAPRLTKRPGYLAVHSVEKSFGTRKVVRGVSIYVRRGEAVGLLGPNGAGKTTVFYMITGLIKADRGAIELDGHDVTKLPMYQRARLGIGYLPQEASIFRGLTRRAEHPRRAGGGRAQPRRSARPNSTRCWRNSTSRGCANRRRSRCPAASAAASKSPARWRRRPNYMLLDEPFAGIDPIAVGDIQDLVRHLTNRGIGVLITDHNVRETLGLTDRAYIVYAGRDADRGQSGGDRQRSGCPAALSRRGIPPLAASQIFAIRQAVYIGLRLSISKNRTNFQRIGSCLHGTDADVSSSASRSRW